MTSDPTAQRLTLADKLADLFGAPPPFQDSPEALREAEVMWMAGMEAGTTGNFGGSMKAIDGAIELVGPRTYLLVTRAILRNLHNPMDMMAAVEIEQAEALMEKGDTYYPMLFPPGFQTPEELRQGFARPFLMLELMGGEGIRAKWRSDFHHALGFRAQQREEGDLGLPHFANALREYWNALSCYYAARALTLRGHYAVAVEALDGLEHCAQEDLDHLYGGFSEGRGFVENMHRELKVLVAQAT